MPTETAWAMEHDNNGNNNYQPKINQLFHGLDRLWAVNSDQTMSSLSSSPSPAAPLGRAPGSSFKSAPTSSSRLVAHSTPVRTNNNYLLPTESPIQQVPHIDPTMRATVCVPFKKQPAIATNLDSNEFYPLAIYIKDGRCEPANVFEMRMQFILKRVLGRPEKRLEAIQSGMVDALARCLRVAAAAQYRVIVQTLAEITKDLSYYPGKINDTLYVSLASILMEHCECLEDTLETLLELTKFEQGQNSAFNAKVPRTLGLIIEKNQNHKIVKLALRIISNIAQNPPFTRALIDANVFVAFRKTVEKLLLKSFHEERANECDQEALKLLWTAAMSDDPIARDSQIRQVTLHCYKYCNQALLAWQEVLSEWAAVMLLCVRDRKVLMQVKNDFFYNAFIVLRYGDQLNIEPWLNVLREISGMLTPEDRVGLVNANVIDALLERRPVDFLWGSLEKTIKESKAKRGEVPPRSVTTNALLLITCLLQGLPQHRNPAIHTNNIMKTLHLRDLGKLVTLATESSAINALLTPLFEAYNKLGSWIRPSQPS